MLGLSENASLHSAILQANVLPPLVRQLKAGLTEAKISAALTMASLASDSEEAQRTVLAAGAVPVLVSMLPSGKAQVAAARALAKLCGSVAAQNAVSQHGGIPLLLSLLNGVNIHAQVHAAAALAELARDNEETQRAIAKAGGIGPLLALVPLRNSEAQANSACALARLANRNRENQETIARLGGAQSLLALLSLQSEGEVRAMGAYAIAELCYHYPEMQALVAQHGAISSLVVLLRAGGAGSAEEEEEGAPVARRGSVESVRAEAAGALCVLAEDATNRVSIVAAGALSPLVQLLAAGGTQRARTLATDALAALAIDIEDNLSQLSAQLVNLLSYGSGEAKERGLELLWRLRHENA